MRSLLDDPRRRSLRSLRSAFLLLLGILYILQRWLELLFEQRVRVCARRGVRNRAPLGARLSLASGAQLEEVDKVREGVLRVANEMANTPIDKDTFIRAWTPIVEDLDSSLENNSYWLSVLGDAQTDASGLTRFRVREPAYRNMTAEEISALAKQVFGGSNEISAYILPAKMQ